MNFLKAVNLRHSCNPHNPVETLYTLYEESNGNSDDSVLLNNNSLSITLFENKFRPTSYPDHIIFLAPCILTVESKAVMITFICHFFPFHRHFLAIPAYFSATSYKPSICAISLYPATPMIAFTERLALWAQ